MRRILVLSVILILFFNGLTFSLASEYGEDGYLYQVVDELTDSSGWGYNSSINLNSSLDALELNYADAIPGELENFSQYTEADENGDLTVTDYKIDFSSVRRDAAAWVVDDKGAGYFTDFEIDIVFNITDIEAGDATGADSIGVFSVANSVGGIATQNGGDTVNIRIRQEAATDDKFRWNFIQRTGGVTDFNYIQALGTNNPLGDYWLTLKRNSTGVYFEAWNDAARTSLNWAQSETTNDDDTAYRYVYGLAAIDSVGDGADHCTGSTHNLDLNEDTPAGYDSEGYIFSVDLLSGISGGSLVDTFNSTIPSGDSITVQWSSDNSTWVDSQGAAGSDTLTDGYVAFDLRELNYSTIYRLLNMTDGGADSTPRLDEAKLIYFNMTAPSGDGADSTLWGAYMFSGLITFLLISVVVIIIWRRR